MAKTPNQMPNLFFKTRTGFVHFGVSYLGEKTTTKTTGIKIENGEKWSKKIQNIEGNEGKYDQIQALKSEVRTIYHTFIRDGKSIKANTLFDFLTQKREFKNEIPNLVGVIDAFIAVEKKKLDNGTITAKTYSRYRSWNENVKAFLSTQFKTQNIALDELKPILGQQFDEWLKAKKSYSAQTHNKNMWFLARVLEYAVLHEFTARNVLKGYKKQTIPKPNPKYLFGAEIEHLKALEIHDGTLNNVRWQFLFMCYSGMNHTDIKAVKVKHLSTNEDGETILKKPREKTKILATIPVHKALSEIIKKFDDHSQKTGYLLPVISLDKFNSYLQSLQALSGITRVKITTGIGRKTFATTLINRGVSAAVIVKATGHSKEQTLMNNYAVVQESTTQRQIRNAFDSL